MAWVHLDIYANHSFSLYFLNVHGTQHLQEQALTTQFTWQTELKRSN
jgi:hypothetical protein